MELDEQIGDVKIRPLGGVNERLSPIDLPPSEFSEVKGLFPRQNGLLERIWGSQFLDKLAEAIISINATYNSSGHILIQTATKRYLTTLDELFNRNIYVSDLDPATSVPGGGISEEETMSLAIVIGKKAVNTNGKDIATTYGPRDLSDIDVNEGGIVSALAANVFTLVAGSYRIRSWCCNAGVRSTTGSQPFIHRLYNETNSDYLFKVVGVVSAASTAMAASTPAKVTDINTNVWTYHIGTLTLTGSCNISIQSITNNTTVTDGITPREGRPVNMVEPEVYTVIEILKTA